MNPQWHDEFLSLCALFPTGDLTEEEWALLQVHLAYCDSCLLAFKEYQQLAHDVLPVIAASANVQNEPEDSYESSSFSVDRAERKLMKTLNGSGARAEIVPWRKAASPLALGLIAAGIVGLAFMVAPQFHRQNRPYNATASVKPVPPAAKPITPPTEMQRTVEMAQRENIELQNELDQLEKADRQLSSKIITLDEQLKVEQRERIEIGYQRDATNEQLALDLAEIKSLRDKLSTTAVTAEGQLVRSSKLEAKLHELSSALEERERIIALDKELLTHDRDIRDLIGARDLYIADIYDVAKNGKTAKPFGRIFYTKDRSLVFYGYDLDKQVGLNQSVGFQAWGSGDNGQNVSLGMFYQDESHKRWILRFDDKTTLARLNKVFVTAEPQGGSSQPTGRPLLMANLQMTSNHP
jgi:hypothetical protein